MELAKRDRESGYLKGRRVIVYSFVARPLLDGKWPMVRIDGQSVAGAAATRAVGRVIALAPRPRVDADYPDYVLKVHVADLKDEQGRPVGGGEAMVRVLAMKDRKLLPAAGLGVGDTVRFDLLPWKQLEPTWGRTMTGSLPELDVELNKSDFWGEPVGRDPR